MIDFLKLAKAPEKKIESKPLFVVLVFIVSLLVAFSWSKGSPVRALSYLPPDTVFYYQWAPDQDDSLPILFFDKSIPQKHSQVVRAIFAEDFPTITSIIWLRTADAASQDKYLVQFSHDIRKAVSRLVDKNQEYYFYQPDKYTVWVSPSPIAEDFILSAENSLDDISGSEGINIFWRFDTRPEFLADLTDYLWPLIKSDEANINITGQGQKTMVTFFQPLSKKAPRALPSLLVPKNFSSGMSTFGNRQDAVGVFVKNNFPNLPYQGSDLWQNSILFKDDSRWLIISPNNWQNKAQNLVSESELKEVSRQLPDGTNYIELVAADDAVPETGFWDKQAYWHLDGLWGSAYNDYYYLSNDSHWLRSTLSDAKFTNTLWQACGIDSHDQISNFFSIDRKAWLNSRVGAFLADQKIEHLAVFTYFNNKKQGWRFCWQ